MTYGFKSFMYNINNQHTANNAKTQYITVKWKNNVFGRAQ